MALPLVFSIGSALLAGLTAIFTTLISWFGKRAAKAIIIKTVIITALVGLTVGLFVSLKAVINGLNAVMPSEVIQAWTMFAPDNFTLCLSAIIGARILIWSYSWQVHFIEMYLK